MKYNKYPPELIKYCKYLKSAGMRLSAIRDFIQAETKTDHPVDLAYLSRLLRK